MAMVRRGGGGRGGRGPNWESHNRLTPVHHPRLAPKARLHAGDCLARKHPGAAALCGLNSTVLPTAAQRQHKRAHTRTCLRRRCLGCPRTAVRKNPHTKAASQENREQPHIRCQSHTTPPASPVDVRESAPRMTPPSKVTAIMVVCHRGQDSRERSQKF